MNNVIINKLVSIIVPCYNEEKNIPVLYENVLNVMAGINTNFELILIDDGSRKDNTWGEIKKIAEKDTRVKALKHGRNLGMTQTYQNGFDHVKGDYVLTYSADLETKPEEIANVIKKLDEGYDVVNTNRSGRWKTSKSGAVFRNLPSSVANAVISNITGVDLHDGGSGLKGFRRYVVDNLKMYGEMHRYFAQYCALFTDKITEIDVSYQDRVYGESYLGKSAFKASIQRLFTVMFDLFALKFIFGITKKPYKMMPGRLFGTVGSVSTLLGLFGIAYLLSVKIIMNISIGSRPLLTFSVMFLILGVQLLLTGFLGELFVRVYFDTGGRKTYYIKERINLE